MWRGVRFAAGLVIGAWSAVAELISVLVSGVALLLVLAWPHGRQAVMRPVAAGSRRMTEFEVVRQLLTRSTRTDPLSRLTERERDVLAEMTQGHTNAAIATRLHVSRSAVEKHTNAIFDKLELPGNSGYSRRVLAVLRYLGT